MLCSIQSNPSTIDPPDTSPEKHSMQESPSAPSISNVSSSSTTSDIFSYGNFEIPSHWRPETMECIETKRLTNDCRVDIVRTLVTLVTSKVGPKPSKSQLEQVAYGLILKYPFMKDDLGSGYVSLTYTCFQCLYNQ